MIYVNRMENDLASAMWKAKSDNPEIKADETPER
jgi:hypothetical protein